MVISRLLFVVVCAMLLAVPSQAQDSTATPAPVQLKDGQPAPGLDWMVFESAFAKAKRVDKPVIVDVYAPWCGWCTRLQSEVYSDEAVQEYIQENFIVTRLNIDAPNQTHTFRDSIVVPAPQLAQAFGAQGTPTTVFLSAQSDYITRLPGFVAAPEFLQILTFIGTEAFKTKSYQEFLETQGD